jgi:RimJ/RimL family protein N-acetyltransferase
LSDEAVGDQPQADADFALARLRVDALFTRDNQGDLVNINELEPDPPPGPAPRVYLGMTAGGIARAYRHDVPAALRVAIDRVCEDAVLPAPSLEAFLSGLTAAVDTHAPSGETWELYSGPAYVFPEALMVSDGVTLVEPGHEDLLVEHFPFTATWLRESWPCYAILVDGRAVAICDSARRTAHVAEAGADTAEEFRGRGYAALVTAAWAQAVRAAGITPVYSTSHDNLASQAVARKLGLREFGWDVNVS